MSSVQTYSGTTSNSDLIFTDAAAQKVKSLIDNDKIKPKDIGIIGIENTNPLKNNAKLSIQKKI